MKGALAMQMEVTLDDVTQVGRQRLQRYNHGQPAGEMFRLFSDKFATVKHGLCRGSVGPHRLFYRATVLPALQCALIDIQMIGKLLQQLPYREHGLQSGSL
ncbi:hypothetical protein D3C75_747400 [compost metagenome]